MPESNCMRTMSAPQLGFLVARSVSSSRDFEVSEKTSAFVFRRFQNLVKTRALA
jgi:hypothetical protein